MINYKKLAGSLFLATTLLVSCTKEVTTGVEEVKYSGAKLVSFNNYAGYTKYNAVLANKLDTVSFQLKLSNTTGTAESPIRVTLIRDNAIVSEFNTNNGASLVPIPVNNIFLLDSVVTFQPGQRTTTFKVVFNSTRLGGGTVLGVGIAKVEGDGATVIGDITQNRVVIEIGALNQYDGIYRLRGSILRDGFPAQTGSVSAYEMPLVTTGTNSVEFDLLQRWADGSNVGINYPVLTVQANNSVIITSSPAITPPVTNTPGYNSRYDPTTKTFYISFYWNGNPSSRLCTDTLTYLRPR